jgi:hypothetical protein
MISMKSTYDHAGNGTKKEGDDLIDGENDTVLSGRQSLLFGLLNEARKCTVKVDSTEELQSSESTSRG